MKIMSEFNQVANNIAYHEQVFQPEPEPTPSPEETYETLSKSNAFPQYEFPEKIRAAIGYDPYANYTNAVTKVMREWNIDNADVLYLDDYKLVPYTETHQNYFLGIPTAKTEYPVFTLPIGVIIENELHIVVFDDVDEYDTPEYRLVKATDLSFRHTD